MLGLISRFPFQQVLGGALLTSFQAMFYSKAVLLDPGCTRNYNRAVLSQTREAGQGESRTPHSAICEVDNFGEEGSLCPHPGGARELRAGLGGLFVLLSPSPRKLA